MDSASLKLTNVVALLVDRESFARGLVAQMLRGFGINTILTAANGAEAKDLLSHHQVDIAFIEGELPDTSAADLITWIRHNPRVSLRHLPVIVLSGYTQLRMIAAARDAGAHLVVKKPLSPQILFDRLAWVANLNRPFLETPNFTGPDRRFHAVPVPDDKLGRETDAPKTDIKQA